MAKSADSTITAENVEKAMGIYRNLLKREDAACERGDKEAAKVLDMRVAQVEAIFDALAIEY